MKLGKGVSVTGTSVPFAETVAVGVPVMLAISCALAPVLGNRSLPGVANSVKVGVVDGCGVRVGDGIVVGDKVGVAVLVKVNVGVFVGTFVHVGVTVKGTNVLLGTWVEIKGVDVTLGACVIGASGIGTGE